MDFLIVSLFDVKFDWTLLFKCAPSSSLVSLYRDGKVSELFSSIYYWDIITRHHILSSSILWVRCVVCIVPFSRVLRYTFVKSYFRCQCRRHYPRSSEHFHTSPLNSALTLTHSRVWKTHFSCTSFPIIIPFPLTLHAYRIQREFHSILSARILLNIRRYGNSLKGETDFSTTTVTTAQIPNYGDVLPLRSQIHNGSVIMRVEQERSVLWFCVLLNVFLSTKSDGLEWIPWFVFFARKGLLGQNLIPVHNSHDHPVWYILGSFKFVCNSVWFVFVSNHMVRESGPHR